MDISVPNGMMNLDIDGIVVKVNMDANINVETDDEVKDGIDMNMKCTTAQIMNMSMKMHAHTKTLP